MNSYKNLSFLCGYFTYDKGNKVRKLPDCWAEHVYDNNEIERCKKYFYNEFVDFCMNGKKPDSIRRYIYNIDKEVSVTLSEKENRFLIKNITAHFMPYNMVVYAIEIEKCATDLNDITELLFALRSITNHNTKQEFSEFTNTAIMPLVDLYSFLNGAGKCNDCNKIIENGNKFKIFQIINSESPLEMTNDEKDIMLFELGTLSKVGAYDANDDNSVSECYLKKVIENNTISLYNNWCALSLLDTFTILSSNAQLWLIKNWVDTYFRLIYVHSLFMKFYLFKLNVMYRKDISQTSKFEDELRAFESKYCFHKISYNFLPLKVYDAIDKGLEIHEEQEQIYHLIDVEEQRREKKNDKKVNRLLLFLTLLTMFSTIWDSNCLFNELFPYSKYIGSTIDGYKIVTSLLTSFIIVIVFLIFNKKK